VSALLLLGVTVGSPARAHDTIPFENVSAFEETIHQGIFTRNVLYLKPTTPTSDQPAPVLVLLPYLRGLSDDMADLVNASALVRDYGAWVIVPRAVNGEWNYAPISAIGLNLLADDVGFLTQVIDNAIARFPVDPHRVYMGGYSNGARMTLRYACEQPGKIAAAFSVAGALLKSDSRSCKPSVPMPLMMINGTDDAAVQYGGNGVNQSAPASALYWAQINGCGATPAHSDVPDTVADHTTVQLDSYRGCTGGASVDFYTITGGGHTWPGALDAGKGLGVVSQDIDATALGWAFVSQFSR
jgi:polyhydroxybutyrate depolymerase